MGLNDNRWNDHWAERLTQRLTVLILLAILIWLAAVFLREAFLDMPPRLREVLLAIDVLGR